MPITITGSKYGSLSLSSVSDPNRVVVSTAPFLSADFPKRLIGGRIVALWSSAAAAFKGVAWVRRFLSSNTLELEGPFIDPASGAAVAQAVGDVVHVSKNWAEVAQAGIVVDNERITVTDSITWGIAGVKDSVCFYDEGVHVRFSPFGPVNDVLGGCVVQGHLEDYSSGLTSGGCKWVVVGSTGGQAFVRANSEACGAFLFFGGGIESIGVGAANSQVVYLGSQNFNGTDFSRFLVLGVQLYGIDLLSRSGGGNWSAPQNHVVRRCTIVDADVNFGILSRWGNGVAEGLTLKVMRYADLPLSIFGSDSSGAFSISSPADTRTVIRDVGNGNALWRSAGGGAQTVNYVNVVTPTQSAITSQPLTQTFSFQDTIKNLVPGSVVMLVESSTDSVAASVLSSGTSWTGQIEYDRLVNAVRQPGYRKGPWTASIKRYGYTPVSWSFAAADVSLGPAGTAQNVSWGRTVLQVPDQNTTLTQAQADALTSISSLDQLYDALIAWSVRSVLNATVPALDSFAATANGSSLDFGDFDLVLDPAAADAINIVGLTITVKSASLRGGVKFGRVVTTGSLTTTNGGRIEFSYADSSGSFYMVSVPNLQMGRVQLFNLTTGQELFNADVVGGLVSLVQASPGDLIRLRADHALKLPLESTAIMTASGITFLDGQSDDEVYANAGVDGSTVTEFTADGANIQIDISDPDGVTSVQRLYAWLQHYQTTQVGIGSPFFGAMRAIDPANFVIDQDIVDLRLDNVSPAPLRIVGGYLSRKDGSTIIAASSGSIHMDPGRAYAVTTSGGAVVDNGAIASAVWSSATRTLTSATGPTAEVVSAAVRSELAPELSRIDVAVSSRLSQVAYQVPPTSASVAQEVRTILAPEIARIDAPISSRLATQDYVLPTEPNSAQISAAVWSAPLRTLTVNSGLTPDQEGVLSDVKAVVLQVQTKVDAAL